MFDWIVPLFARGWSGLTDLANTVRDALTRLALGFIGLFLGWMREAVYVANAAIGVLYASIRLWHSLGDALARLALVTLPNLATYIFTVAYHYIEAQAMQAYHYAEYVVGLLRQEVSGWVNNAIAWTQNQLTRLTNTISQIITLLNATAGRVFALLTDPQALADWVGGHIVRSVWRWALGNAEVFTRLALGNAVSLALSAASVIERIIADVFL